MGCVAPPPRRPGLLRIAGLALALFLLLSFAVCAGPTPLTGSSLDAMRTRYVDTQAPATRGSGLQASTLLDSGQAAPVEICGTATFTVTITNAGPDDALNVQITDSMPVGFSPSPRSLLWTRSRSATPSPEPSSSRHRALPSRGTTRQ